MSDPGGAAPEGVTESERGRERAAAGRDGKTERAPKG